MRFYNLQTDIAAQMPTWKQNGGKVWFWSRAVDLQRRAAPLMSPWTLWCQLVLCCVQEQYEKAMSALQQRMEELETKLKGVRMVLQEKVQQLKEQVSPQTGSHILSTYFGHCDVTCCRFLVRSWRRTQSPACCSRICTWRTLSWWRLCRSPSSGRKTQRRRTSCWRRKSTRSTNCWERSSPRRSPRSCRTHEDCDAAAAGLSSVSLKQLQHGDGL